MTSYLTRRALLVGATALGASLSALRSSCRAGAEILDVRVIGRTGHYQGWPTLARRSNGELLLVYSGGREAHVCPFGRVELLRSRDEGRTWSFPRVLMDGPIDDRDAGVVETAHGSILVTTFTSLAYQPIMQKAEQVGDWPGDRLARWQAAHRRVSAAQRRAAQNVWMIRSIDGGVTFSPCYDPLVNSPHGPIQLSDGRLLYAGKDLWRNHQRVGASISTDDGQSWQWRASIPTRDGDRHRDYHELHAVEATNGDLIVHVRNHNAKNSRETLQSRSSDGGRTWSVPRAIGVWGLPSHLLRLSDGRLLMTYGHRRPPFGNQCRLSEDHGKTWSEPIVVSDDGVSSDLGYPTTVELTGGDLLSVWYELMQGEKNAVLRQARWRLG
ncbi:MAG: sialidase family protein [Planctomycetota bacterium]